MVIILAVFVDEVAGCDTNGNGTEATPFKSVIKALEAKGDNIKIQIKKDADGFKDISGAALKKAKKALAEQQKKAKKLEEQKSKQDADLKKKQEDEAKALEHAKSIVLSEDKSLPEAQQVSGLGMNFEFINNEYLQYHNKDQNPSSYCQQR